jgi:hypothetical protein
MQILDADAQNAYLNAPVREKVYTTCGPEFGISTEGCYAIIVQVLCGLKSSGAAWRAHLTATMEELMFTSCIADPDVWLRPFQNEGGLEYYEYVLIYTDDFLCISDDPKKILDTIGKHFKLQSESIKIPETYMGANLGHFSLPNKPDKPRWSMSSTNYVKQAVANVEKDLSEIKRGLPNKASLPMSTKYRPELDVSPVLNAERANYFQSQIGVLRWAVEIGCIDICVKYLCFHHFSQCHEKDT